MLLFYCVAFQEIGELLEKGLHELSTAVGGVS